MKKIIPRYAYFPLILAMLINTIVYNCSKLITNSFVHYDFSIKIDSLIELVPSFVIIYILSYIEWAIGYIIISREDKQTCYYYMSAEIIAKLMCLFFFFIVPTTMERPIISNNGIFELLTNIIYKFDDPVNLFPSIHCLESWMCFRGSIKLKKVPKFYKYFTFIFSILVFLSVVFVKQHVFVDIIGGIIVVELGLIIAKRYNLNFIFEKIEAKIFNRR